MPFTSSSLIVSNFALCGIPFLTGFHSRDFIWEMFSIRYMNIFGFLQCCRLTQTLQNRMLPPSSG